MDTSSRVLKIRPHRGSFEESMSLVQEVAPTKQAISAVITSSLSDFGSMGYCLPHEVTVEPYANDERDPEWEDTFIVKYRENIFGYTNGPLDPPLRYVWLNIATGEFSDSWLESDCGTVTMDSLITDAKKDTPPDSQPVWKLIEYRCLTDDNFQFDRNMRLP